MRIPKQFILHGHTISVREVEKLKSNAFGEYDDARELITIAHKVESGDELVTLTSEQIEHTFWHEVIHAFQWHTQGKYDEAEAQAYAGLMIELIKTSGLKIDPNTIHEPINNTYDE